MSSRDSNEQISYEILTCLEASCLIESTSLPSCEAALFFVSLDDHISDKCFRVLVIKIE